MTGEPRAFSRVAAGFSSYDGEFRMPLHALEKEMATHSGVLGWRIPGMAEPGGLPSMGSQSRTRLKRLSSLAAGFTGGPVVKNPPANAEDTREEGAHQSLTLVAFYSLCREPAVFTTALHS